MRKATVVILCLFIIGCAGFKERSPDEQKRIILNQAQSQLETFFDIGKQYVVLNPQHQEVWKAKIVPAFKIANDTLKMATIMARTDMYTPEQVKAMMQVEINKVLMFLIDIGAIH